MGLLQQAKEAFRDDGYGLFIHWGLYALLGGCYEGKQCQGLAEWILQEFDIPLEKYRALAKSFNPLAFDAKGWVQRAKQQGFRYICLTAKHHDGFALFHSKVSAYNVVDASPFARDIVGELAEACQEAGLKFCVYYSQAQDWDDPRAYRAGRESDPVAFEAYFEEKCLPQVKELLTQYGEISMIWFDTPMGMTAEQSARLRDWVHQWQPACLISGRLGHGLGDYRSTDDNMLPTLPQDDLWEMPATLNHSWGYKKADQDWRQPEAVWQDLLKVRSRGGNLLLNVGPDPEGNIPLASLQVLDKVGGYLQTNREAIQAVRPVAVYPYEQKLFLLTQRVEAAEQKEEACTYLYISWLPETARSPEGKRLQSYLFRNLENLVLRAYWVGEAERELDFEMIKDLEGHPHCRLDLRELGAEPQTCCLVLRGCGASFAPF